MRHPKPKDSVHRRVVFSSGFSTGTRRMSEDAPRARGKSLKDNGAIETIKISNVSTAKRVGAAMAHLAREGKGVDVKAGSAKALSTALKAVAVARKFLRDNEGDLGVSARIERGDDKSTTVLTLVPAAGKVENASDNPYTVSSKTDPSSLSGALAARVRESKTALARCVGVAPAARAATALALATSHVEGGNVVGYPFFQDEGEGEERVTVLNLLVKAA